MANNPPPSSLVATGTLLTYNIINHDRKIVEVKYVLF